MSLVNDRVSANADMAECIRTLLADLLPVMTADQGQRRDDPQIESILGNTFAIEWARMIGLGALAHKGRVSVDIDQGGVVEWIMPAARGMRIHRSTKGMSALPSEKWMIQSLRCNSLTEAQFK